jgi:CTP:molybdopterin cytidylyltransferase MocA
MADTAEGAGARSDPPKLRWDDSKMTTHYANVANAFATREEIVLLLGTNQTWQSGQDELVINLSNRIIMNPMAARRLLASLERAVNEFESRAAASASAPAGVAGSA